MWTHTARVWALGLLAALALAFTACSAFGPSFNEFEDGTEFERDVVADGDRSGMDECEGDGFCRNGIAMLCSATATENPRMGWDVCLTTPRGEKQQVLPNRTSSRASLSPGGALLLIDERGRGYSVTTAEGEETAVGVFESVAWFDDDRLLISDADSLRIVSVRGDQPDIEIEPLAGHEVEPSGFAVHPSGAQVLFFARPRDADLSEFASSRRLWLYDLTSGDWKSIDTGQEFVSVGSRPGFGSTGDDVIVQLSAPEIATVGVPPFRYRLVSIDIASGEIETIERSEGVSAQFHSVSPDGRMVAIRGEQLLRIVNVETGRASDSVVVGGASNTIPVSWSPDSNAVVAGYQWLLPVTFGGKPQLGQPIDLRFDGAETITPSFAGD